MVPTSKPISRETIEQDLSRLKIQGETVVVHSSLSSMGYVVGGPVAVIQALLTVLGPDGTLVMPGFTSNLSEPENWLDDDVPQEWKQLISDHLPAFQADLTPTYQMGVIPETFRKLSGTKRSNHPWASWLANGPQADFITQDVAYDFPNGDQSPLGRLYTLNAYVLFLGTSYQTCSCLHLAEMRNKFAVRKRYKRAFRILRNNQPEWQEFDDIYLYDRDFEEIGAAFEQQTNRVRSAKVASANVKIFRLNDLVDFAVEWMNEHRSLS